MSRWSFAILGLVIGFSASAEVFKSVEPDGSVLYSDRPKPGAETITTPKEPPTPASPVPSISKTPMESPKTSGFKGYDKIEIVSPTNDETIRENTGAVSINVALTPPLETKLNHKLALFLDGNKVAESENTAGFQLMNLDRGTHTVRIGVLDAEGNEVAGSEPATFHLLRFSTLLNPSRPKKSHN